MGSSLVVQTGFLGDVILTTPLIAVLAQAGEVDVVTTPVGAAVLKNNPDVRRVVVYDKRRGGVGAFFDAAAEARRSGRGERDAARPRPGGARRYRTFGGLRHVPLTLPPAPLPASSGVEAGLTATEPGGRRAYLAQGSLRSAAVAVAAGYGERVGFATSGGRALYTRRVQYHGDWHHVRRLLSLVDEQLAEGASAETLRPRLYPGADDVAAVDALLDGRTRPFIAVAPGSVWATKRWPGYGELGRLLNEDFDVAVVGGKDDLDVARDVIAAIAPERVVDAAGKLSILGSAELLRRAAVVVTNDSAPQHLASAVGTPTVAVFGPTVPGFGYGPLAAGSRVIGHQGLACRPCDRHGPRRCPLGHWRCMREVEVGRVHHEVMEIMRQRQTYDGIGGRGVAR